MFKKIPYIFPKIIKFMKFQEIYLRIQKALHRLKCFENKKAWICSKLWILKYVIIFLARSVLKNKFVPSRLKKILNFLTCACLFGSKRNKQPTCCVLMWIIPAQTKLSGFGSMPPRSCIPNPCNFVLTAAKSIGWLALNIFCDFCWFTL